MEFQTILNYLGDIVLSYAPKIAIAIVTLVVGLWLIKILVRVTNKALTLKKIDPSLRHFLDSLISISLKVLLIITVISMLGVQTSSFVALLAAAGFAIGLALQGSLGNFAGGVLILLFKPFKVGHFVEVMGHAGTVDKIDILNTILKTGDNKTIILPNGPVSNSDIVNYSIEDTRRVDFIFGVGYDDDLKKVKTILQKIMKSHPLILQDKANSISMGALNASSVDFKFRVWVKSQDYWTVHGEIQEQVKEAFDKAGISIPYPQQDIHIHKK